MTSIPTACPTCGHEEYSAFCAALCKSRQPSLTSSAIKTLGRLLNMPADELKAKIDAHEETGLGELVLSATHPKPRQPSPEPYLGCMRHMWTDDGTEGCPSCARESEAPRPFLTAPAVIEGLRAEMERLKAVREAFKFYGTTGCAECENGRVTLFVANDKCISCDPQSYERGDVIAKYKTLTEQLTAERQRAAELCKALEDILHKGNLAMHGHWDSTSDMKDIAYAALAAHGRGAQGE